MRKESFILIFGTFFSIATLIGLKVTHFYVHGRCDCLSGKLFEYIIPFFGLVAVIFFTNNTIVKLIKRRETEFHDKIKVSEEKYLELFETITDGIVFSGLEGNIISCNKGFLDMLGYTMKEIRTKSPSDITPLEWRDKDEKILKEQIIKRGYSDLYEKEYIRKDGKAFPVSIRGWTIKGKESKPNGVWYIIRDIAEHKKMEAALLQSEKLKSLGIMASGIAHDFNNILTIISGKVQLLKIGNEDNKELTDELSIIRRATNDGAEIASRMLKFTKTTKDTTGFVLFDSRDLINQAIDFTMPRWKNMAQANGINYHIDKEGIKEVPAILCNPTELRGVFINIINNALDAMPDGGCISFGTWSKEDTVFISISDTGEGMLEEVKKSIFEPFFTTKLAVGTGLGRSISYGIIIGHGGQIDVESEVEQGTTFTLQFPTGIKTASPKVSPKLEQEIKSENLSIMVVDDDEDIRNILDKFLSMSGHKVKVVDNGAEAIKLAKKENFNLVLCDMAMPEVFGYDVIKALNELEKRPKIGIITGWGEKLKPLENGGLKVDFIIKKPFDFSELSRHINKAFST